MEVIYEIKEKCEHGNEYGECGRCREAISRLEVDHRGIKYAEGWEKLISTIDHGGIEWQAP